MFEFPPLDEAEAMENKGFPKLKDGWYDFEPGQTPNGNSKTEVVQLIVHENQEYKVWDTFVGVKNMMWKFRHYCETTGLEENYKTGKIEPHLLMRRTGKCYVTTQPEKPNPNGGVYKSRNIIEDYLGHTKMSEMMDKAPELGKTDEFINDALIKSRRFIVIITGFILFFIRSVNT